MSERRSTGRGTTQIVIVGVVLLVLVAGAVYWFAIRDDDDPDKKGTSSNGPVAAKTFTTPGVPFTFKYPGNFQETSGPQGFIWIAGVGPYDILDVKRIANEPRPLGRLRTSSRQALSGRPDLKIIKEGLDQRAGVDLVRFDVETTVNGLTLRSELYYFSLGGVTWQFECESQAHRDVIDAACSQALSSFTVSPS